MRNHVADRAIRDLFQERAERGKPRGADLILVAAGRQAGPRPPSNPVDRNDRRRWAGVIASAAAVVVVIAAGSLLALVDSAGDDVELSAENDMGADGGPAPNSTGPAPAFAVEEGQLVPLLVLDRPSFRVTGGHQTPIVPGENLDVGGRMWTYRNPSGGLGEPFLILRTVTDRWHLDEGDIVEVGGAEARLDVEGPIVAVQWPVGESDWLLIGVGLGEETLFAVAESVSVDQDGRPLVGRLPEGFEMAGHFVPDQSTERAGAEFNYALDGGSGDILIRTSGPYEFHSELLDRLTEAVAAESVGVAGVPAVAIDTPTRRLVIWQDAGFMFELRSEAPLDEMLELAASVRPVGASEWESVVPPDWIGGSDADEIVAIVADIPLPPGFDLADVTDPASGGERYQVIAESTGAVACAWIDRWIEGRSAADAAMVGEAEAALSTAHEWDALVEIADQGGWSSVLWEYADAVGADGTVIGGTVVTVEESYQEALGCNR